jgi:hypothetical protein
MRFASWQFPHIFHNGGITRLAMDDILVSQREQKLHIRTTKTSIQEKTKRKKKEFGGCQMLPFSQHLTKTNLVAIKFFFPTFTL